MLGGNVVNYVVDVDFGSQIEQIKTCQKQIDEGNVIADGWVDGWRVSCIQIASSMSTFHEPQAQEINY